MKTKYIPVSLLALILYAVQLFSQSAENVLLIVNETSPISLEIGQYYAQKRSIPAVNILRLKTKTEESIAREDFIRQIEKPITDWITKNSAHDRILYFVLTKGIPLRVEGSSGQKGTVASVDSELTLLYSKLLGMNPPLAGWLDNPYFMQNNSIIQAKQFSHESQSIYLVSRLDGYSFADIRGLIDRGVAPSSKGIILLDQSSSSLENQGNAWLKSAADQLKNMGFQERVVLENTAAVLTDQKQVLGYYSWGSNDKAIQKRHFNFEFVPGALAGMYVSSDGRSFKEPPTEWKIGSWEDESSYFAGSPQSMAGDMIHDGITSIAGHVAEPYLQATIRPNILFPTYLFGFNLIESYYLAMPYLSWQTVVIGDPLCAPFRTKALSSGEIDKGLDPETELPRFFSGRIAPLVAMRIKAKPEAVKYFIRAEARLARGDTKGAMADFMECVTRDNQIVAAHLQLASSYEQSGDYDKAIERYQQIIKLIPENSLILNNLAYALAVHKGRLDEALPIAEKAYILSKENPNISDTLGWIYHLKGNNEKSVQYLETAAGSLASGAEVNLHAAIVLEIVGQKVSAKQKLLRALELDKEMEKRPEVQTLRKKLML